MKKKKLKMSKTHYNENTSEKYKLWNCAFDTILFGGGKKRSYCIGTENCYLWFNGYLKVGGMDQGE